MRNISAEYGSYYGKLLEYDNHIIYSDWTDSQTEEFIEKLMNAGVVKVFLDVENGDDYSSTMFFETTDNTDFRELMVLIANIRPHEFSEETPHHFRMWFD